MRNDFPIHTRPFDYDAAKTGAPVVLECGFPLTIYKWDCNNSERPIVGIYGQDDRIGAWHRDGSCAMVPHSRLGLLMAPIGYLDGKPVFVGDSIVDEHGDVHKAWAQCQFPGKWRWPALPKSYPVTAMTDDELFKAANSGNGTILAFRTSADAAIRHYIDHLMPLSELCALRAKLVEMGWTPPEVQG